VSSQKFKQKKIADIGCSHNYVFRNGFEKEERRRRRHEEWLRRSWKRHGVVLQLLWRRGGQNHAQSSVEFGAEEGRDIRCWHSQFWKTMMSS
jgi:hypothetical protein